MAAASRNMFGSTSRLKVAIFIPLICSEFSARTLAKAAAFSLAYSSSFLRASLFSPIILVTAAVMSGTLLNISLMPLRVSETVSRRFSAASPVKASILRTPAAIADSETILKKPILPVEVAWVPPQSSTEGPNLTTLTRSPYFSPNRAIAPIPRASSIVASLFSSRWKSLRIIELTRCSTLRISSSVTFEKCEKSNLK